MVAKNKAIFLDRDGVLVKSVIKNKKGYAPKNMSEFSLYTDVTESCQRLKKKNYLLIIITNQPDLGKKLIKEKVFNKMNKILNSLVSYDKLYVSRSHSSNSYFRKPNPGLFKLAIKKYKLDISKCFMIGDRKSDIDAASKVKCRSIFIDRKYKEKKPRGQIIQVNSLKKAVNTILKKG
jgi:D-glycero-D-manno-heptose 1,7-bisphosphate phosphatase